MKKDQDKTKEQLITELGEMRQRVAQLEASEVERVQTEKSPLLLDESCQRLFEFLPIGVTMLDMKGVILYSNPAVYNKGGYAEGEFTGKHFSKIAPIRVRDIPKYIKTFNSIVRGKAPAPFEVAYTRKDGTAGWTEVHVSLLRADNKKLGVLVLQRDITEHKRAEEEVREFKLIADSAAYGVAIGPVDGILTYVNKSFAQMHRYTPDELIGRHFSILYTEEQMPMIQKLRVQLMQTGSFAGEEMWHRRKDGTVFPTIMTGNLMRDEKGNPSYLVGTTVDITERRKTEEDFENIFNLSPDMEGIFTIEGGLVKVNRAWEKILGYKTEELLKMGWAKLVHPDDVERTNKEVEKQLKGSSIVNFVNRYKCKDGSYKTLEWQATFAKDGIVHAIARDITERKRTEEALRESEEFNTSIMKSSPNPILVFNADAGASIRYVNPALEELVGISSEELIGKEIPHPWWPEEIYEERMALFRTVMKKGTYRQDTQIKNKKGERLWIEMTSIPIRRNGEIQYYLANWVNITERKRAEEALQLRAHLLNHAADSIAAADLKGNLFYVNDTACRTYGYTQEEMLEMNLRDMVTPKQAHLASGRIKKVNDEGYVSFESEHKRRDGSAFPVEITSRTIKLSEKTIILSAMRDITERKQLEHDLRERVKDLNCLYLIDNVAARPNITLDEMYQEVADILPLAYQYPEIGCARIVVDGKKFQSHNYQDTKWKQSSDITVDNVKVGTVEVNYRDKISELTEDPFLLEEKQLIKAAAERLGNITERQRTEEELRDSEQRLKQFFNNEPNYCYMISTEGTILDVNQAALNVLGYNKQHLVGQPLQTIYAPESHEKMKQNLERWKRTGVLTDEEMNIVSKDGNKRTVLLNANAIRNKEGKILHSVSVQIDITERKQAEQRLKDSEQKYINAEQMGNFGHFSRYLDTNRLVWSAGSYHIFGVDPNQWELTRENIYEMVCPQDRIKLSQANEKIERGAKGLDIELRIIRPDGEERVLHFVADVTLDNAGKPERLFGTMQDITKQKRAEEQLVKSQSELRSLSSHLQAAREEERTSIAGEIHDELGQALTALKIDVSWIRDRLYNKQKHLFEKSNAISGLIDETLGKVQRISAELRPSILDDLGLVAAVEWLVEEFQTRTGIQCQLSIPDDPVELGQEYNTAIFRILQESLINISRHAEATRVRITLRVKPDMLALEVIDNGKGIEITQIDSSRSFGLISMKERAYALSGEISISGIRGKGTTINVHIPLN